LHFLPSGNPLRTFLETFLEDDDESVNLDRTDARKALEDDDASVNLERIDAMKESKGEGIGVPSRFSSGGGRLN
jgi:hypothetical protein